VRILIADDSRTTLALLGAALRSLGHEAIPVPDGQAALEALESEPFPLVISDWQMPRLSGVELCRAVREREARHDAAARRSRYTYLILLTALEGRDSYLEGMKAGADDLLTKPYDNEQLAARLRVAERIIGLLRTVDQLSGLLPICSYCKNIREGGRQDEAWVSIETYVSTRTEAAFSHGVCPTCYEKVLKPQLDALRKGARGSMP
jgi:phosphoserine phosphatase RsbU/P